MTSPRAVLAVDLGKSRCRAVLVETGDPHSTRRIVFDGIGAPGLAADGGVRAALDAILPALGRVDAPLAAVSVGAAGAWAAPTAAAELARRLATDAGVSAVVASDVVSAHAGALDGGAGVLLIAGTGAAALGVDADGARLVDGWGPELGDFGSGSWLGREALRAVLRASVLPGAETTLTHAIVEVVGAPGDIQPWLSRDGHLPRRLATLAPLVLDAAAAGDAVAARIAAEGVRLLTASAVDASTESSAVALHGGLTDHARFRALLEASLQAAGRRTVAPLGDALDGARLLAERTDLPHERFVHRAE